MRAQSGYLHCFWNIVPRDLDKQKKSRLGSRARSSVKLRFLRLEKMPKNDCPKNVQILWVSKTSYNGSNKALFESKIQTKKQNSLGAVEQKDLYFYELYKKSKKNKGNLTILYFYLRK